MIQCYTRSLRIGPTNNVKSDLLILQPRRITQSADDATIWLNTIRFKDKNDFGNCLNHGVSICAERVGRTAIAIEMYVMYTID